jgi:hypothetical protein
VLSDAAAGALGTYLMSPAILAASRAQPDVDKEWEGQASWDENATVKAAKKAVRPLGVELGEKKDLAGRLVHWGYGIEIAVPALKLGPRPQALPPSSHAKALWAHLVYGAATEGALRVSRRVLQ